MTPAQLLKSRLQLAATRQRRLWLWGRLAACWAGTATLALFILVFEQQSGWASSLAAPLILVVGIIAALILMARHRRTEPDWRRLAGQIEAHCPQLDGRLLTAVQQ